ncbi:hypothetical protein MRX96_049379, partial [Rhipicephalus microplus]
KRRLRAASDFPLDLIFHGKRYPRSHFVALTGRGGSDKRREKEVKPPLDCLTIPAAAAAVFLRRVAMPRRTAAGGCAVTIEIRRAFSS